MCHAKAGRDDVPIRTTQVDEKLGLYDTEINVIWLSAGRNVEQVTEVDKLSILNECGVQGALELTQEET